MVDHRESQQSQSVVVEPASELERRQELAAIVEELRSYRAPTCGKPFSREGMEEIAQNLMETAIKHDSALHEMCSLIIGRAARLVQPG